jgi:hypothetical protein
MTRVAPGLPERLLEYLQVGAPALLLTIGQDGYANAAYTWAAAPDAERVRFGADAASTTFANLERTKRAALQVIGAGDMLYLVKGTARLIKENIAAADFSIAMMELSVAETKNQAWQDVTVAPLAYAWPAEKQEAMRAMEEAVYAELREWEAGT